jgi:hypothetical protein
MAIQGTEDNKASDYEYDSDDDNVGQKLRTQFLEATRKIMAVFEKIYGFPKEEFSCLMKCIKEGNWLQAEGLREDEIEESSQIQSDWMGPAEVDEQAAKEQKAICDFVFTKGSKEGK